MFELRQLQCFVAVSEELNFRRAASRIHMTQPPLNRQIPLLEHEMQVQLFARTSRSVELTPAGSSSGSTTATRSSRQCCQFGPTNCQRRIRVPKSRIYCRIELSLSAKIACPYEGLFERH